MDIDLKKLWSFRKSKGRHVTQDSGASRSQKSHGTGVSARHISQSPRIGHSGEHSLDYSIPESSPVSAAAAHPPGSIAGNPIKTGPAGIRRPSTSQSRPGTSGSDSLMSAVNRAADAISRSEQEYQDTANNYFKRHVRTKTPRYVDIFSLASPNSISSSIRYNEDVAERNLDLTRVALEASQNDYFQEEVAMRNAYPTPPASNGIKTSPPLYRDRFSETRPKGQSEHLLNRTSNPEASGRHEEHAPLKYHKSLSSNDSHRRQQRDQSWGSHPVQELNPSRHQTDESRVADTRQNHLPPPASHVHANASLYDPLGIIYNPSVRPTGQEPAPTETLTSDQLSATESAPAGRSEHPGFSQPGNVRYTGSSTGSKAADFSLRSPSSLSHAPSVKRVINLPHRKIMDLTGDDSDVFSEVNVESNYSSSPVIGHAKVDVVRRISGLAINGAPAENTNSVSDSLSTNETSTLSGEVPLSVSGPVQSPPARDQTSEVLLSEAVARHFRSKSGFSAISTVAASSPRASVVVGPSTTTVNNAAIPEGRGQPKAINGEHQHMAEGENPANQHAIEGEPTRDEATTLKHDETPPVAVEEGASSRSDATANERLLSHEKPNGTSKQDGSQARSEQSHPAQSGKMPSIQDHKQGDFAESPTVPFAASHLPDGVITRDFADMASRSKLTSVPEGAEPGETGRPKRLSDPESKKQNHTPAASTYSEQYPVKHVSVPPPPMYKSTFDEAEFARKQAEARAALIRLQESLNENFLEPIPAPAAVERPSSTRSRSGFSEHKQKAASKNGSAPASSVASAEVRHETVTATVPPEIMVQDDDGNIDGVKAKPETETETSYHNLATLPHADVSKNREHVELVSREKHRGKQRAETSDNLDGPGPSVLDQAQTQSLPLPPSSRDHFRQPHQQQQHHHPGPVPPSPGEVSLSHFPIPVSASKQSATSAPMNSGVGVGTGNGSANGNTVGGGQAASGEQQQPPTQQGGGPSNSRPHSQTHPASLAFHSRQNSETGAGAGAGPGGSSRAMQMRRQSSQRSQASTASAFSIPYHLIPGRSSSIRDQSVAEVEGR
ncbi:hypothetical protein ABEF95_014479 [Exophiala dermatitidis]|uniref:Uncharacterized protein n=1 Tax=Exophiala dermatitidis (strain ATCC 34100 / CBS 525.76 / NIH/UT8656) TaxID=858893 RepID=H6C6D1_EXODN|nr:uncharacterized protein HMPREF1120_07269 [Exophiala dermatitidis NIH/UT8656]EHY59277.1 hypothetical protein HMPREF1120_07269 [Exophiala dermatitidis NIH/UT8656]